MWILAILIVLFLLGAAIWVVGGSSKDKTQHQPDNRPTYTPPIPHTSIAPPPTTYYDDDPVSYYYDDPAYQPFRRDEYLPAEKEKELVQVDSQGIPNFVLARQRGQIVVKIPGRGVINPRSRTLYKTGVFIFRTRGTDYYQPEGKRGSFTAGKSVGLVREPNNKYDPNAVKVTRPNSTAPVGYVNKQNAARMAKIMDSGKSFEAISMKGDKTGVHGPFYVLAAQPHVMEYLLSTLK